MRCYKCRSRLNGGGYTNKGKTYCCRTCAKGATCLCRERQRKRAA